VVTRSRQRGYTLMEVVVAMSIFVMFLAVVFILTAEMRSWEKRLPINMHKHPQVSAVLARLRKDVVDGHGAKPYRNEHEGFEMDEKVLILESVQENGGVQMIVWDFREPTIARRISWNVGAKREWVARGLPPDFSTFEIGAESVPNAKAWGVRIQAKDPNGNLAIDQILLPRATEDEPATPTPAT
jgi:prepilin-type N-terminal cleavage/methylation domain-containing protein